MENAELMEIKEKIESGFNEIEILKLIAYFTKGVADTAERGDPRISYEPYLWDLISVLHSCRLLAVKKTASNQFERL